MQPAGGGGDEGGLVVQIQEASKGSTIVARVVVPRVISFAALRTSIGEALRRPPDSFMLVLAQNGELGGPQLNLVLHPLPSAIALPPALIVPPRRPIMLNRPRSKSFSGGVSLTQARKSVRRRSMPSGRIEDLLGMSSYADLRTLRRIAALTAPVRSNSVAPITGTPPVLRAMTPDNLSSSSLPLTPISARRLAVTPSSATPPAMSSPHPAAASEGASTTTEEAVNSDGLLLRKGELVAATTDGFLSLILGAQAPSPEILDELLLTYRYWAAPTALLSLLAARFDAFGSASGELRGVLRLRVLSTLRRWLEGFFHDFERDETLLNRLLDFVDHALKTTHGTQLAKWSEKLKLFVHEQVNTTLTRKFPTHYIPLLLADELLAARSGPVSGAALSEWLCSHLMIARQKALIVGNQFTPRFFVPVSSSKEQFFRDSREAFYTVQRPGATKEEEEDSSRPKVLSRHRTPEDCSLMKVHATELARQLTLVEHELFRAIEPPELLFANWKRDAKRDLSPHVCAVIDHFNRIIRWATTEILSPPTPKLRRAALSKLLQVGIECRKLNNFNGVMEVISALQSTPIQRLKQTWRGLPPKELAQFTELVDAMDFVHHLRKYRDELEKIEPPALPYIGLFLQDLLMIEEIPTRTRQDAGLINVGKLKKVAAVVRRVQRLQMKPFIFKTQPAVHAWLSSVPVLSDAEIEQLSRSAETL